MVSFLANVISDPTKQWLGLAGVVLLALGLYVLLVILRMSRNGPGNRWSRVLRKPTNYHPETDPWRESAKRAAPDPPDENAGGTAG
jgi:hypothetical protein